VLLKDGLSKGSRERRRAGGLPTSLRRLRSVHVTAMRPKDGAWAPTWACPRLGADSPPWRPSSASRARPGTSFRRCGGRTATARRAVHRS